MERASEDSKRDRADASTNVEDIDIFQQHINSYDNSKTVKVLNFIYSFIVGVLSSKISQKSIKNYKLLGVLMACASFAICRKFLKIKHDSSPSSPQGPGSPSREPTQPFVIPTTKY